jgi:stage V sporulation protein K
MGGHLRAGISRIRVLAEGGGGHSLMVAGSGAPFYAGLHRPPATTLLEALLTFVVSAPYEEIIVFSSAGEHVPRLRLGPRMTSGLVAGGWLVRGSTDDGSSGPSAPPEPDDFGDMLDIGALMSDAGTGAEERVLFAGENMSWPARLERTLQLVEERCGYRWQGMGHEQVGNPAKRALVLIDERFLVPQAARFGPEDLPPAQLANTLAERLTRLPTLVLGTRVDVVAFFGSRRGAEALRDGTLIADQFAGVAGRQAPPVPEPRWAEVEIADFPAADPEFPFGEMLPGVEGRPLYGALRSIPPQVRPGPIEELEALTGLGEVKSKVREIQARAGEHLHRQRAGLPNEPFSLNTVFYGNPGTGKTTVARVLARVFVDLGLLSGNKVTEATRASLVAGYVGQTAPKTRKVCEDALGGVLFIDEAYSLARGGENDFGSEAIDELLRWMSEYPGDLAVIAAGYPQPMESFLRLNEGLAGRFNFHLRFPDYTDDDLVEITRFKAEAYKDVLAPDGFSVIKERLAAHRKACATAGQAFRNAGEAVRLLTAARSRRALRTMRLHAPTRDQLSLLTAEDFRTAALDIPGRREGDTG